MLKSALITLLLAQVSLGAVITLGKILHFKYEQDG